MKKEYDFSQGERGKFYHKDAEFHLPVYLEPDVQNFIARLAKAKKTNLSDLVNQLLLKDKELLEYMRM